MRLILLLLIRGYQLAISPLFPPSCRFIPSCSEYARQALEDHGLVKGTLLASWRLLRCQPLCSGGLDPVPDNWPRQSKNTSGVVPSASANLKPPTS